MARDKKKYKVYCHQGVLRKYVDDTDASSEEEAINNVVYRLWGKIPKDRRPILYALLAKEDPPQAQPKKGKQWEPKQLYTAYEQLLLL